jgi:hypothetical protein
MKTFKSVLTTTIGIPLNPKYTAQQKKVEVESGVNQQSASP